MEGRESLFLGFVEAVSSEARECNYTYLFWTTPFFIYL